MQLADSRGLNTTIVLTAYTLMCIGLAVSKLLAPNPQAQAQRKPGQPDAMLGTGCLAVAAILFSCSIIVMLIETGGLLDSGGLLEEGGPLATLVAVGGFLGIVAAFPVVLLLPRLGRIAHGTAAHWLVRALAVALINTMVLVTAAFWEMYLAELEPMDIAIGGRILVFVVAYPIMLAFYAPPRLAILLLEPDRWSIAGYFALLAVYVWGLTA